MRQPIRYQSKLLLRRSYKPSRILRIRLSARPSFSFRPARLNKGRFQSD